MPLFELNKNKAQNVLVHSVCEIGVEITGLNLIFHTFLLFGQQKKNNMLKTFSPDIFCRYVVFRFHWPIIFQWKL